MEGQGLSIVGVLLAGESGGILHIDGFMYLNIFSYIPFCNSTFLNLYSVSCTHPVWESAACHLLQVTGIGQAPHTISVDYSRSRISAVQKNLKALIRYVFFIYIFLNDRWDGEKDLLTYMSSSEE